MNITIKPKGKNEWTITENEVVVGGKATILDVNVMDYDCTINYIGN